MKIPFDIKYRPQIENGEYRVVTTKEQSVRIICWDRSTTYWKIIALVLAPDGETENPFTYDVNGKESDGCLHNHELDLFIVTPEEEMTPFEKGFLERVFHQKAEDLDEQNKEIFLEDARCVLELAREQFIKDGYVIEKKAFHDAVGNISDKHLAEMSVQYSLHCKVEDGTRHAIMNWDTFQKVAQKFIDIGKAEALKEIEQDPESSYAFKRGVEYGKEEALKDLPRWKSFRRNSQDYPFFSNCEDGENCLVFDGKCIKMCELLKLPGFNEDEK